LRTTEAFGLLLACACAGARSPVSPPVSATALKGVTVGLPVPQDARPSANAGCGQFAPDMPRRLEKALIAALGEAGATIALRAPWRLTVALTYAGAGAEYQGSLNIPVPEYGTSADQGSNRESGFPPVLAEPRGGVNAGWTDTSVALDATLDREGKLLWHGTVTGHAKAAAPCIEPRAKLDEALGNAVSQLRAEVIRRIASAP
jgi:hypothetical protein